TLPRPDGTRSRHGDVRHRRGDLRRSHGDAPHRRRDARDRRPRLLRLGWSALPLGLASGVTALAVGVPSYALGYYRGEAALGVFAALGYLALAGNTLVSAVAVTLLPRMAELHAAGRHARLRTLLGRLVMGALVAGAVACVAAFALGRPALELLYGPPYPEYATVLPVVFAAATLGAAAFFLDAAVSATRRFGQQLGSALLVLGASAGASAALVPWYGVGGAAWAMAASAGTQCVVKGALLRRSLRTAEPT
ncbi:MAG TPA: hypothetical protein VGR21_09900, partial [Cryptosporangiaceae bacterium]|nr:hypothetical protein [Cryptosporangiaceae bacterium]